MMDDTPKELQRSGNLVYQLHEVAGHKGRMVIANEWDASVTYYPRDGDKEAAKAQEVIDALQEAAALKARIAELEDAQRWVSVDERLPEWMDKVIVKHGSGKVDVACFMDGAFYWLGMPSPSNPWPTLAITHWRPLTGGCAVSDEIKDCWSVWVNSDLTEGRGFPRCIYVCEAKATAIRLAKGRNVQGSDGSVAPVKAYRIDGTWYTPGHIEYPSKTDSETQKLIDVRDRLIAKAKQMGLSDEEINLLKGNNR